MNNLNRTDSEVYHLGIDALINYLGTNGAVRFLNQIEPPIADYTRDRHQWLDKIDRKIGITLIREIKNATK